MERGVKRGFRAGNTIIPLAFGDLPVPRQVSSTTAVALPAGYRNGSVNAVSGHEADMNASGAITITDWVKIGRGTDNYGLFNSHW